MAEAAVFDGVVDTPEYAGRVLHRLLLADLSSRGAQVGDVGPLVVGGDLEAGTGAGRILLEDQCDVLALELLLLVAAVLGLLEGGRELQEKADLAGREVEQLEKAAAVQMDRHRMLLRWDRGSADRSCSGRRRARGQARRPVR